MNAVGGRRDRRSGRSLAVGAALLGLVVLLTLPSLVGDVVLQYTVTPSAAGRPLLAPLTGVTTTGGAIVCAATATPTLWRPAVRDASRGLLRIEPYSR